ncbi:MAG: hypothetical protein JWM16_5525 [Verrucomicrobiales bacterium]|nr:hypothetical protein [Verrucomicrobiales bacterium]
MKLKYLLEIIGAWDANSVEDDPTATSKYSEILKHLRFLGEGEWAKYLPAHSPNFSKDFATRLAAWIGNVEETADRQLLLEYAKKLCFFSHDDFQALYLSAFNGPITRWVIQKAELRFDSPTFAEQLKTELYKRTWYCPITDSMDINEFYHVNHISGVEHRPSFATLAMLDPISGESDSVLLGQLRQFMTKPDRWGKSPPLERLVLLEDFVGTGTQMKEAVKWAANKLKIHTLVVPLVICAPGRDALEALTKTHKDLVVSSPIVHVGESELLGPNSKGLNGWARSSEMEALAKRLSNKLAKKPPFGYKKTGCSVVTYSNTPNNSLPLIHHHQQKAGTWSPLFPRSSRI